MASVNQENVKILVQNRKARHDYQIEKTYEAGMALKGPEVKSLRLGSANLSDGYVQVVGGEAFLLNVHISPYKQAGINNVTPTRERKLLLKADELKRITTKIKEKGLSVIPLKIYLNAKGLMKIEIALAKGKRKHDKRDKIEAEQNRKELRRIKKS